ncbi:hypothetical protein JCM6882_008010 [Rhodosporidiobolus microsporus]
MVAALLQDTGKHALAFLPPHLALPSLSDLLVLASRFVFVSHAELPEGIQFVPAACRMVALSLVLPVVALTVVDVVGWAFFKLALRPLGYASTVRFKDPEPPSMLVPAPGATDATTGSPVLHSGMLPSSTSSSSASETSSAPSSPENTLHLSLHDEPPSSSEQSSSNEGGPSPFAGTSPPLSPRAALQRSKSHHHHSTTRRSSHRSHSQHSHKRSLSSDSAALQLERKMSRDRAPSVGLDGPLFESGAVTPSAESEAEGAGAGDYWSARGVAEGRPKGGFKLGLTEVKQRGGGGGDA